MSIAVIYGSTTGMTAEVAANIASALGAECLNVAEVSADNLAGFDALVLGSSTWGAGDLQDDWEANIGVLEGANLAGKKVAVFGTGDSLGFADTFCDAMARLRDAAAAAGAAIVGAGPVEGYDGIASRVVENGRFIGLPLDVTNQPELTDSRVAAWVGKLKTELA